MIKFHMLPRSYYKAIPEGSLYMSQPSTFLVITGVQFFWTELKPVKKVSADANLKRYKHKVLESRVAEPIAQAGQTNLSLVVCLYENKVCDYGCLADPALL